MYEYVPLAVMAAFFSALIIPDRCPRTNVRAILDVTLSLVANAGGLRFLLRKHRFGTGL